MNGTTTVESKWQPITTAPRDTDVIFWLRPKTAVETWHDTSGNPILAGGEPYSKICSYGCWGSLWTATHWRPIPVYQPPSEAV